ncbi:hypothetical protein [Caldimonas brevitalea]|nr:hypothetical protein [Caldimonas brevitalea]
MNENKRVYQAMVWSSDPDKPGERTTVLADDLGDAERQLRQKYGEDIEFSLYNEEDADKPR